MKWSRFFLNLVPILCSGCFLFQTWAANPVPSGSQVSPGNAPPKATVKTTPVYKPDLIVSSAAFNHAPKAGEMLGTDSILNIQVKNKGALQSSQNTVKISCTPLGNKPCPEGLSGTLSCPPLAPNQTATLPWPNSGGVWSAGAYKIVIEADSAKTVIESNEGNNIKTVNVSILANTGSGPTVQGAGGQQYGGSSNSTPQATMTTGQASAGLNKQTQKIQKSQNNPSVPSAASPSDVALSPLSITSPADGAAFYIGKKYTLTWNDALKTAQKVKIMLISKASSAVSNIAKDVPNTGSYEWTVAQGGSSNNNNYTLKIAGMGQGPNYSDSKDVSIYEPTIQITNPKSGDIWNKSVPVSHTITWQRSNMPESVFGSQVRVRIGSRWPLPGGSIPTDFFTTETLNDGEYVFTSLHEIGDGHIHFGQKWGYVIVESLDGTVADKVNITVTK